jgi:hypothetical protein
MVYAAYGITTMQDAPMEPGVYELCKQAAEQILLFLDLISYCRDDDLPKLIEQGVDFQKPSSNHWRVAGVKVIIDGSPQGKTAYFTQPFLTGGPTGEKDYRGEPIVPKAKIEEAIALTYKHNAQVLAHANGDAAKERRNVYKAGQ